MGCLPLDGCERPMIEPLVTQLNTAERRQYVYQACLDKDRWASKKAQPEILYVDESTSERLVIEVKHLTWPPHYVERHKTDHRVAEKIADRIQPLTSDAPYELGLPYLFRGNAAQEEAFVESVVHTIAAQMDIVNAGKVIGSRRPGRAWTFRRQHARERDHWDPPVGMYACWNIPDGLAPDLRVRARTALVRDVARHYSACVKKFADYMDARRILIFSLVGDVDFDGADWDLVLKAEPIPGAISEIWKADYTWVTDWNQDWVFTKLKPTAIG